MRRSLARSFVAAVILLACAGIVPARTQNRIKLVSAGAAQQVRQIDFADWLNAQTTTYLYWTAKNGPQADLPFANNGFVDYAGKLAQAYGLSLGFSATGTVGVRRLPDGTGEVLVNVDFSNAINWATSSDGTPIFGYEPAEVSGGAPAAFASGHIQAKYIVPDPDSPNLNLHSAVFDPVNHLLQFFIHSEGEGALRAGFGVPQVTPGTCIIAQNGILNTGGGGATADGYPVEHVDVKVADGADLQAADTSPRASSRQPMLAGAQQVRGTSGLAGTGQSLSPSGRGSARSWGQLKVRYRDRKSTE